MLMNFKSFPFNQLTTAQLYSILELRYKVFVVEQQSIYNEIDGLDQSSIHYCIFDDSKLLAYTRVRHVSAMDIKIERVVCDKLHRGKGLVNKLLEEIVKAQKQNCRISLSAQIEVVDFYKKRGFKPAGKVYDDGGIPHQDMQKVL